MTNPIIIMTLRTGDVKIELMPEIAPLHCARITQLIANESYDNVIFHRVIEGFMAQGGDTQFGGKGSDTSRAGTGGSDLPDIKAEFSNTPHDRGTLGMARSQSPDSANSQFFINFADNHFLNKQYTVFGKVIDGMNHVDAIARGEPPANPDAIVTMRMEGEPNDA